MTRALPQVDVAELQAVLRAVRVRIEEAQAERPRGLAVGVLGFLALSLGFLHVAQGHACSLSPRTVPPAKENDMKAISAMAMAAAMGSGALAQDAVQWRVEDGGNGHWYRTVVLPASITWGAARAACESNGGHLVTVTSASEGAFVRGVASVAAAYDYFVGPWLGGYQDRTAPNYAEPLIGWRWVTDEPWYSEWSGDEPNNGGSTGEDFLCFAGTAPYFLDLNWNDFGPHYSIQPRSYIIEFDDDCNSDGIVDYGQTRSGALLDTDGDNIPDCCEQQFECRFDAVQWRVEDGGNGHWYASRAELVAITWSQARLLAQADGADLACITSLALHDLVEPMLDMHPDSSGCHPLYYIGLSKAQNQPWRWINGLTLELSRWICGEPADPDYPGGKVAAYSPAACESLCAVHTQWDDMPREAVVAPHRGYLIEWSSDCNSDGIVDYGQIRDGELDDANTNNIPDCCEQSTACGCVGDADGSGFVNGVDLAAVLNVWGTDGGKYPGADINRDGTVNATDLAAVLNGWGACP